MRKLSKFWTRILLVIGVLLALDMWNFHETTWTLIQVLGTDPGSEPVNISFVEAYGRMFVGRINREIKLQQEKSGPRDMSLENGKYKTFKNEYFLTTEVAGDFYWMDNERIIFNGATSDQLQKYTSDILIWKVGEDTTVYEQGAGLACFANGKIVLVKKERKIFAGELNHEQEVPYGNIDEINCRSMPNFPEKIGVRELVPLKIEHGALGFAEYGDQQSRNLPVVFYKAGGDVGELPFTSYEVGGRTGMSIRYYDYKGAYLLIGSGRHSSELPVDMPHPAWWLYPDGHIEEEVIPAPWGGNVGNFFSSKIGLIYTGYDARLPVRKRNSGVFLLKEKYVDPLMQEDAHAYTARTSPDGCRLALSANELHSDVNTYQLYVINLCVSGE